MPQTISQELQDRFKEILKDGDEARLRQFLVEHFQEFPQNLQDTITLAFFEEALLKENKTEELITTLRREALTGLETIERTEEELEKQAKLAEIKNAVKGK